MKLRLGQLNQASARRASKLGAELNLLSGLNRLISGYFSGGLSLVVWARIFRMRLARRSRRRRTAWSGTLRRYISRTCRAAVNEAICPLGSVAAAVLTLLFKLISQLASIPALGALQMYFLPAASLPLAVWLVGGPTRHVALDDILARYPQIGAAIFCADCGLQMSDGAVFCSRCGKPTGVTTPAPIIPGRGLTSGRLAGKVFLSLLGVVVVLGIAVNEPTIGVYYRASKGDAIAQADLGFLYSQGHGVPQACQKAARLVSLGGRAGICTSRP